MYIPVVSGKLHTYAVEYRYHRVQHKYTGLTIFKPFPLERRYGGRGEWNRLQREWKSIVTHVIVIPGIQHKWFGILLTFFRLPVFLPKSLVPIGFIKYLIIWVQWSFFILNSWYFINKVTIPYTIWINEIQYYKNMYKPNFFVPFFSLSNSFYISLKVLCVISEQKSSKICRLLF